MGIVSTITGKGQTTVPKEVRRQLGLEDGTRIEWRLENGEAIISPRKLRTTDLFGLLGKPRRNSPSQEEIDAAVAQAVSRHVREGNESA
jgi:antitoxin PrlF